MTTEQIQERIDNIQFTYLGKDEEFNLKKVLTGINGLATGGVWGGITGSISDQTDLISGGKILPSLLPALAITDTSVVSSEAAMLALTAETGDIAVRTDETKTYILKGTDPSVLADWELLLTPTGGVVSVFGRSGAVTAQSGDYSFSLISGTAGPTQGGTGLTTYAKGDVLIATGLNTVGVVAASSTDGYVFTWDAASGLPMWKAASGGGTIDTSADYSWTGKHTFSNIISGTGKALEITPSLTAIANNQTLTALNINPTLSKGSFTGLNFYGIDCNGTIRSFGSNTSGVSFIVGSGSAIRGDAATGGVMYIDGSRDLTGTINLRASSVIFNLITMSGNNLISNGGNISCGHTGAGTGYQLLSNYVLNVKSTGDVLRFNDNSNFTKVGARGSWQISNRTIPIYMTFEPSAIFHLDSVTQGFLPPRMQLTEWTAIPSKAEGLQGWNNIDHAQMWYDGTRSIGFRYNGTKFQGYDGTSWIDLN